MGAKSWFLRSAGLAVLLACGSAAADTVHLAPVASILYPDDQGAYSLILQGDGAHASQPVFRDRKPSAVVFPGARPIPLQPCDAARAADGPSGCFDASDATASTLTLRLRGVPTGRRRFAVAFGEAGYDEVTTTFSPCGPALPGFAAGLASLALLGAAVLGLSRRRPVILANGRQAGPLASMLIDRAGSSYSLSRLQLYVWLTVCAAAYLYLLAGRVLVQGLWSLPDMPPALAGLALIAAGTSVAATAIHSLQGGPGAGAFEPGLGDLLSSGGDVAPERFQHLLWTLLAAPAVLISVYARDPAGLDAAPLLPGFFLQMMGISAAAYLGGKIVRGPGPRIASLSCALLPGPAPFLVLSLTGAGLQTRGATFFLRDLADRGASDLPLPATIRDTSRIDSRGVATVLDLSIPAAGLRQSSDDGTWRYRFTMVAADGERAEWEF